MKIAIYGAGAVGGLIGARLAAAGHEISAVARGATLEALRAHGLRLSGEQGTAAYPVRAEQDPALLGVQDVVVLAVKSTALPALAMSVAPLIGPATMIVTAMNGVPWWFFQAGGIPHAGATLRSVDPDGALARAIPVGQVIGCVVHLSSSCPAPGVVRPGFGNRLILGEPAGGASERVERLAQALRAAGFEAEAADDIRREIWYKLWGNMTMNPVSAITGATADRILDDPLVNRFCLDVMREAAQVGASIGCPIAQSGEERNAVTRKLGSFKTSMLQDAEAGRPLEIDALVGAVREIARMAGVATPTIDSLFGLVRLYARTHGLYPEKE